MIISKKQYEALRENLQKTTKKEAELYRRILQSEVNDIYRKTPGRDGKYYVDAIREDAEKLFKHHRGIVKGINMSLEQIAKSAKSKIEFNPISESLIIAPSPNIEDIPKTNS